MRAQKTNKWLMVANALVIVGLIGGVGYLYNENQDLKADQNLSTEEQNAKLVEEISEVYELPNETPGVAIVSDAVQFASEYPAFNNAEVGDHLLFYDKACLNILYRQSEKKVLQTVTPICPIDVEIIGTQAAIDAAAERLSQFGSQVAVRTTVSDSITQAFVFDIDNDQTAEAQSIADQLNITVGATLPTSIAPAAQTEIIVAVTSDQETAGVDTITDEGADSTP